MKLPPGSWSLSRHSGLSPPLLPSQEECPDPGGPCPPSACPQPLPSFPPRALAPLQGGCEPRDRALALVSIWPRVPGAKRVPHDRSGERPEKAFPAFEQRFPYSARLGWDRTLCLPNQILQSTSRCFWFTKAFFKVKILCRFIFILPLYLFRIKSMHTHNMFLAENL